MMMLLSRRTKSCLTIYALIALAALAAATASWSPIKTSRHRVGFLPHHHAQHHHQQLQGPRSKIMIVNVGATGETPIKAVPEKVAEFNKAAVGTIKG